LETSNTQSRSFQEEIFGPVVSVVRFKDEAEAIAIANESPYGLSGSIWSRDIGRALRVARGIGRATGLRFAAEGAKVVVADLSEKEGMELAKEIHGTFVNVNVADEESVKAMYAKV